MTRRTQHARWLVVLGGLALLSAACGTRLDDSVTTGASGSSNVSNGSGITSNGSSTNAALGGTGVATPDGNPTGSDASPDAASTSPAAGSDGVAPAAGGETGAVGGASTGATASDPGVSDTEILIGASGPLSGVTGFLGEEAFGAIDSYFQYVNSQGGVNGRQLRLVTFDDRFDSSQQAVNVRRLHEEEQVLAQFLVFSDAVGQYVTRNNIPTLVFGVSAPPFSSAFPTVFPLVGNALLWTQEVIAGLQQQGVFRPGMRVGMLYDTEVLDVSPYLPYLVEAWELAGADVVSTDPFNLSDGDCTSLVLKMRDLNIDYWDFQGLGWVLCASAAQRQQYRPPLGWGNWPTSVAGLASQVGPWVDGVWGGAQGDQPNGAPRTRTAAHELYESVIAQYHPNIATFAHLESPATIGYWVGAQLLVEAITAQGQFVTRAGINQWIQNVQNFDGGIAPPIISMRPDCKTGSEVVWIGQWHWDPDKREATRTPATGYFSTPYKEQYGGDCFLTRLSDEVIGVG
jgi:ABC-type branched-subunit amino acid transport system substrate-binding protein